MRWLGLLAIVAACGDGVTLPLVDAGPDAIERGRVRVHVEDGSPGFDQVYFQAADSTLVLATRTDGEGNAMALMPAGGFVTVYDGSSLYTWADVQDGDELVLEREFVNQPPTEVFPDATVLISDATPTFPTVRDYYMYTDCDQRFVTPGLDPGFQPFFSACDTVSDILIVAVDINGQPLAYVYRANVSLFGPDLDLRGTYMPMRDVVVEVDASTPDFVSVSQTLDRLAYASSASDVVSNQHATLHLGRPTGGFATRTVAQIGPNNFPKEDGGSIPSQITGVVWGPEASTIAFDLRMRDLTSGPRIDPTSYEVTWTEDTNGVAGETVILSLRVDNFVLWQVMAPRGDEPRVRLPVLPQASFRLHESRTIENFSLISIEGGYDRLRPYLLGHWNTGNPQFDGTSGRAIYRSMF